MGEAGGGCYTRHTHHAIGWNFLTRQKNDIFPVLHFFGKQCLWMGFESFSVTKMSILRPRLGPMHNSITPHQPHISGWKSPTLKITGRKAPGRLRVTQEHPKCHKIANIGVKYWYLALWHTLRLLWHLQCALNCSFEPIKLPMSVLPWIHWYPLPESIIPTSGLRTLCPIASTTPSSTMEIQLKTFWFVLKIQLFYCDLSSYLHWWWTVE